MDSCASLAEARGCPIRIFTDQSLFAAPRNFSQRTTSFIASQCQGIHQMLLSRLMLSLSMPIPGCSASADGTDEHRSKKDLYVLDLPAAERSSSCVPRQSAPDRMLLLSAAGLRAMQANPFIHDVNQQNATLRKKRRNWSYEVSTAICRNTQRCLDGGARRDRTDDLKLAKLPLSQLSYGPVSTQHPQSPSPYGPAFNHGGPGKI